MFLIQKSGQQHLSEPTKDWHAKNSSSEDVQ